MKRKVLSVILVAVMATSMLSACQSKKAETKETKTEDVKDAAKEVKNSKFQEANEELEKALGTLPEKDTGVKIAAIESTLANEFWVTMQKGYEDTAKEYGVTVDVLATESDTDTTGQLNMMNDCLVKDYDAIAVSPLSEQNLIPGIVAANQDDVKVVAVGNGVDADALKEAGGSIEAFITSDFKAQGTLGAEHVIKETGGKGKVLIIEGTVGATQSEARRDGAKEAFEKAGMNIIGIETANFDRQEAYDVTTAIIEANPDLVGIACGNDIMALGAIEALKEKDMIDKVCVVGVDFIEEAKESIEAGELSATVAMSPYLFGKAGLLTALKAIQGDSMEEATVWTPLSLVTADTVGDMEGWK
ncbi:substrate-binding domain-containing protein [Lachnospiraceae bacterium LCP25S3_G4]